MKAEEAEQVFETGGLTIPFGKYQGKTWRETPMNYRLYMGTQAVQKRHPELYAELLRSILESVEAALPAADAVARTAAMARPDLEAEKLC